MFGFVWKEKCEGNTFLSKISFTEVWSIYSPAQLAVLCQKQQQVGQIFNCTALVWCSALHFAICHTSNTPMLTPVCKKIASTLKLRAERRASLWIGHFSRYRQIYGPYPMLDVYCLDCGSSYWICLEWMGLLQFQASLKWFSICG